MKYILILSALLLLTACASTAPVEQEFPKVPSDLMQSCPALKTLPAEPTLSEVTKTVAENYVQYHGCSANVDSWIDWYITQKNIFNK